MHVIYQSDRNIQHAFDRYAFYWQIEMPGAGERTTVINGQPRSSAGSSDFASPDQIYVGLNAVRWDTTRIPFDAGLKQTVNVANPNGILALEAPLNIPAVSATTVYDEVTTATSSLANDRFEAPFIPQESFTVSAGWAAYAEDSGTMPINGRDEYVVYAASHLCWHMYYPDWQGNDPLPASFLAAWMKAGQSPLRR